ncbi:MAG: helix-turn-helix transcriptional regulator [Chloroflexia bacterium]|nr:helix-turn-helix transcriptional regulator [Chloroflexia bacterium]
MLNQQRPVGEILRHWRRHRRVSQLDLALDTKVSARHISFLETGRSRPSRDMLLRLAEQLQVPLRDRNTLLVAAGFAPVYNRTPLDNPAMNAARAAIDLVLNGHQPFPALAVDRYWTLIAGNQAIAGLLIGVAAHLLEAPVNVLRVSLHPEGIAPRIINLDQWREHTFSRLERQIDSTADPELMTLFEELRQYSGSAETDSGSDQPHDGPYGDFAIPLKLRTDQGTLSFFSTTTVFGAVNDITLDELAIESFYPADEETASAFAISIV